MLPGDFCSERTIATQIFKEDGIYTILHNQEPSKIHYLERYRRLPLAPAIFNLHANISKGELTIHRIHRFPHHVWGALMGQRPLGRDLAELASLGGAGQHCHSANYIHFEGGELRHTPFLPGYGEVLNRVVKGQNRVCTGL